MPQWLAGEMGYALSIVGFLLLVREWFHVFDTQGNTLARDSLRASLQEWRDARATDTNSQTRTAIVQRMQVMVASIKARDQRNLFKDYVGQLAKIDPGDGLRLDALDRAFAVGTPIEEDEKRVRRRRLMIIGAIFVVVGSAGQMIATYPKSLGPFCDSKEWRCQ